MKKIHNILLKLPDKRGNIKERACTSTQRIDEKEGIYMLYIGVDLGTSAVKLLLMDGEGKIRKIVSREYTSHLP